MEPVTVTTEYGMLSIDIRSEREVLVTGNLTVNRVPYRVSIQLTPHRIAPDTLNNAYPGTHIYRTDKWPSDPTDAARRTIIKTVLTIAQPIWQRSLATGGARNVELSTRLDAARAALDQARRQVAEAEAEFATANAELIAHREHCQSLATA